MSLVKNRSKKLVIVALASILLVLASSTVFSESEREQLIQQNLAPIGKVNVEGGGAAVAAAPAVLGPDAGKKIYEKGCAVCHGAGVAGSPKFGDKAAWAPRIKEGEATLVNHALHGYNAMPAKGACPSCSDAEIKAAVEHMIDAAK